MNSVALTLSTWFGCGYFPWGPGTVGSLAALLIGAAIDHWLGGTRQFLFGSFFLLLIPAVWASTKTAAVIGRKDPGLVVVDEVLGQWVTLLGVSSYSVRSFVAGFVLFRIFDIWKPWPVRNLEKLPGGYGIVADDLAAGLYGALILYLGGIFGLY
ncbi:MAG: phosphatidylglycerophosphatase A [Bryobacteraceae bacterium]